MSQHPSHTLILLRHGKSAYPLGVPDHGRPLADRGRREAALAGEHIRAAVGGVDRVLCSTAARTRQTLDAAELAGGATVDYADAIYAAEPEEILDQIRAVPDQVRTLLVIGHAPGIPELAMDLAGPGSDRQALEGIDRKFPTSAFAIVTVRGGWSALPAAGRLVGFTVPRKPTTEETR